MDSGDKKDQTSLQAVSREQLQYQGTMCVICESSQCKQKDSFVLTAAAIAYIIHFALMFWVCVYAAGKLESLQEVG